MTFHGSFPVGQENDFDLGALLFLERDDASAAKSFVIGMGRYEK